MRKVVLGLASASTGTSPARCAVDFLFMPKDYSMGPFFATIDTAIMGRKTYDVGSRWVSGFSDSKMKSYVFSIPNRPRTRRRDLRQRIAESLLKNPASAPEKTSVDGRRKTRTDFLKDDIVDELYIGTFPSSSAKASPSSPAVPPARVHPPRKQNLLQRPNPLSMPAPARDPSAGGNRWGRGEAFADEDGNDSDVSSSTRSSLRKSRASSPPPINQMFFPGRLRRFLRRLFGDR